MIAIWPNKTKFIKINLPTLLVHYDLLHTRTCHNFIFFFQNRSFSPHFQFFLNELITTSLFLVSFTFDQKNPLLNHISVYPLASPKNTFTQQWEKFRLYKITHFSLLKWSSNERKKELKDNPRVNCVCVFLS